MICPELLEGGLTQDMYNLVGQLDFYKIVLSLGITGQDEPIVQKGSGSSSRRYQNTPFKASAERIQILNPPVDDLISTRITRYLVVEAICRIHRASVDSVF